MNREEHTIYRAGAGSGKTYTVQQKLGEWIAEGTVRPDRVLAVTFTEAAALELRERITARLLEDGRLADALKLSQAYISTIHAFGLRLLTEFAFEAGISPRPRLLSDDEKGALIRRALAQSTAADDVAHDLAGYGYTFQWITKRTAADQFRDHLLRALRLLRQIGIADEVRVRQLVAAMEQRLSKDYGDTKKTAALEQALLGSIHTLLQVYPRSWIDFFDATSLGKGPAKAFRRDYSNLKKALGKDALKRDWTLWNNLQNLRTTSTKKLPLPEKYTALADRVKDAARGLDVHPGPLEQTIALGRILLTTAHDIKGSYQKLKAAAGLVDYMDMNARAEYLLRTQEDVRKTLAARIDCLVVDEFQDTNPLQFALLWALKEAGIPKTLVVGDLKQAIMGFQGADPRLFQALATQHQAKSLPSNWRSQRDLMAIINAFGSVLFGKEYDKLSPEAKPGRLPPLEIAHFPTRPRKDRCRVRAWTIGNRIKALLADETLRIKDRSTKKSRGLRGSDIAVLCPTNFMLKEYAAIFRQLGLHVKYREDGWLASRPVQIVLQALTYLVNPADRHAALYLAATELGEHTLPDALAHLIESHEKPPRIDDAILENLDDLRKKSRQSDGRNNGAGVGVASLSVHTLVARVLQRLKLFDRVMEWPDSEQHRANLIHLLSAAREFTNAEPVAMAHGGLHGSGVPTFLSWLRARTKDEDQQPEKKVLEQDAIVLSTWHSAKGLEWPVVVAAGLHKTVEGRLPDLGFEYASFDDLSQILSAAEIQFSPLYVSPTKNETARAHLDAAARETALRLLYVVLSRPRNKLIIEWPDYLATRSSKAQTYWSLLRTHQCSFDAVQQALSIADVPYACHVIEGDAALPDEDLAAQGAPTRLLSDVGRRAIRPGNAPRDLTLEALYPSDLDQVAGAEADEDTTTDAQTHIDKAYADLPVRTIRYGQGVQLPEHDVAALREVGPNALGVFLHRCFEVLGQRPDLADTMETWSNHLASGAGRAILKEAVVRFEDWMASRLSPANVLREWPLLGAMDNGTIVSGVADMIVETTHGVWILDHKSEKVRNIEDSFRKHGAQLDAYIHVLSSQGKTVLGAGIHWLRTGQITWGQFASHMILPTR